MWYLIGESNGQKTSLLLSNRVYKVGRLMPKNEVDLSLDGDQSVSRLHAEIIIKFDESKCTSLENRANIVLTDLSKFGTFVNNLKVDQFITLNANDVIRFGLQNSSFKLRYEPLLLTTSCIVNLSTKKLIKTLTSKLGGYFLNDWNNECSFVVMESITITIKVISALICQKYIITKNYLEDLVEASSNLKIINLDPLKYLPPIGEDEIKTSDINYGPSKCRQNLFKGKKFIFFTDQQLQKSQNIIEMASGECVLFDKTIHLNIRILSKNLSEFLFIKNININSKTDTQEPNIAKLSSLLESLNQRMIDETEIGMAILHAKLEKYCNSNDEEEHNITKKTSPLLPAKFKMASQTLTQTFETFASDSMDTQQNYLINAALESQGADSIAIQFASKCTDLLIVPNTPEAEKTLSSEKKHKRNDTVRNDSSGEMKSRKKLCLEEDSQSTDTYFADTTNSGRKIETKNTNLFIKDYKKMQEIQEILKEEKDDIQIMETNEPFQNFETQKSKLDEVFVSNKKLPSPQSLIKSMPKLKEISVNKSKNQKDAKKLNDSNIIYTKSRPPKESFRKPKTELETEQYSKETQIVPKIKFECLVVNKGMKCESSSVSSSSSSYPKSQRNFKKFRKVPKATKNNQEAALFKSFKDEPFDVDSQFQIFMNSK